MIGPADIAAQSSHRDGAASGGDDAIHLVFACDTAYAMPLATALRSLAEAKTAAERIHAFVLSDGMSDDAKAKVLESLPPGALSITWHPVALDSFAAFGTARHISKMTYARFLMPLVIPASVSRVLYLDTDILVLRDLRAIWETKLDGAILAAARDLLDAQIKSGRPGLEKAPRVANYFNAGVLLIDMARWRTERLSERALQYLADNPRSPFSDQDALNVCCDGRWKELGQEWNFQRHADVRIGSLEPGRRPGIVHFVTGRKPWKPSSLNLNSRDYDSVRDRTLFARTPGMRISEAAQAACHRLLRRSSTLHAIWMRLRGHESSPWWAQNA